LRGKKAKLINIVKASQLACLLEASAPKPGNVYPFKGFPEMNYVDFLLSTVNLGAVLYAYLEKLSVGELIYRIVCSTYRVSGVNVNLGIALLLVPLAKAYWEGEGELRFSLKKVLDSLTVEDAKWVYKAIRMVSPGGMGKSEVADVSEEPSITLREAMIIASERDSIAYEYSSAYRITFEITYPVIKSLRTTGMSWEDVIVEAFLTLLSRVPDSLISRKFGVEKALWVSKRAAEILKIGGVKTEEGKKAIRLLDEELRQKEKINPGTTADLIAAGLMLYFLKEVS